ncbi:unnamed protein product [Penicillium olsonii]|nr:unnamed protein product [Penicillium olsonii]
MRRKKLKLQNLDAEIRATAGDVPPIFRGVVAHVNGYTQPSLQDLHRMIVSHGGGFLQYLDGKTVATHIIASALTPKKREEFRRYRIVKPAWVTDSIKAGRLLSWDEYRIVDEGHAQKVLKFGDGQFTSQTNNPRSGYKDQSRSSWYNSQLRDMENMDTGLGSSPNPVTPSIHRKPSQLQEVSPAKPSQQSQSDYGDFPSSIIQEVEDTLATAKTETHPISNDAGLRKASEQPLQTSEDFGPADASKSSMLKNPSSTKDDLTSEEYNAQLLSDPRMKKSSVVNPDFLQQYYRESRLHHLSTWKAELKAQLQAATTEKTQSQASKRKPIPGSRRYILHVDFDSFFAAVSLLKHPELKDKPVAIAHGSGSGSEIASCNYPARAQGVRNGTWMKGALESCPDLKVLPYDFPAYEDASRKFYSAILAIDGTVQSVSIDEALIDITGLCLEAGGSDGKAISEGSIGWEQDKADDIALNLRNLIKEKTGCAVSVGIGGNILLAKVSLRKAKPAGQFQLKPDAVLDFLGDLTVRDLPGVGHSMAAKLEEIGAKFVGDMRNLPKERLISALGPKTGIKMWEYARGIDRTEVGDQVTRKSVSAEVNWGIRFVNQDQADEFVRSLCSELNRRLMENLVKGKQLTLKVMRRSMDAPLEAVKHLGHGKCDTFNKSVALGVATNAPDVVAKEAISMLRSFNFSPGDLRGLGVQMTKLEPLKTGSSGLESSQRQLNFGVSPPRKKAIPAADPDELESPHKDESIRIQADPVLSDSAHKPLNISGSQFIMPTQADPKVVAELPSDIRSKLVAQSKPRQNFRAGSPCPPPREERPVSQVALPPQSQLDPETLAALPEDVRSEVLGYYQQSAPTTTPTPEPPGPTPHPPTLPASLKLRRPVSPPKKRRGRPPKAVTLARLAKTPTLDQSGFGSARPRSAVPSTSTEGRLSRRPSPHVEDPDEVSADFLDALPEDIKKEILEEQKRKRLQQRQRANAAERAQRLSSRQQEAPRRVERRLPLPPLPPKPVFTSQRLSQLPDLRDAVRAWHEAFAAGGPYEEDVASLCSYLTSVTFGEKDVDKAVSVVRWLMWLVEDHLQEEPDNGQGSPVEETISWQAAIELMQNSVQAALAKRGLPEELSSQTTIQNMTPVTEGPFSFNVDTFYVSASGGQIHRRAAPPEIKALYDTSTDSQGTNDHPGHWYEAQLLHYGLPPSKVKATAKMRLLKALQGGGLSVPKEVNQIENKLKKAWKKKQSDEKLTGLGYEETNTKTVTTKTVTKTTHTVESRTTSTATRKAPISKATGKDTAAKAAAPKKATGAKATPAKAPATKTPATKPPATRTPATRTPATRTPATRTPATKAPATKAPATKAPAAKTPKEKAVATKKTPATKAPGKNPPAGKATTKKATGPKAPTAKAPAPKRKRAANDEGAANPQTTKRQATGGVKLQNTGNSNFISQGHQKPSEWNGPGYDGPGYNEFGYDEDGYDENGYDENGYDENGYDEDGCDDAPPSYDSVYGPGGGMAYGDAYYGEQTDSDYY